MEPPGQALGYSQFEEYTEAASPEEGFARLVAEAKSLYGDDPYNGTISTCNLGRVVHIADKYSTAAENKAAAWMKKYPGQKWVAARLDCGVTAYRKVTVKKATAPAKGTVYASILATPVPNIGVMTGTIPRMIAMPVRYMTNMFRGIVILRFRSMILCLSRVMVHSMSILVKAT